MSGLQLLDEKLHIRLNDFTASLRLGGSGECGDVAGSGCVGWVLFIR